MKRIFILCMLNVLGILAFAQPSATYYSSINNQTGATLKTALRQVITSSHNTGVSYNGLWTAYKTTDRDYFYEDDGSILDYYSENTTLTDPYIYTWGSNQCGNYSGEGNCYNREHIIPQSLFSQNSPMKNDVHFIRATDGYVNGIRGNLPFGLVGSSNYTSQNGSKRGSSITPGFSGIVFEPVDAFKGDIARMFFYFVTRYETQLSNFSSGDMLGNSAYPGLKPWFLQQLLLWHAQDPVSKEEIHRNNASEAHQGNRNPFIDNPKWVNDIWGTTDTINPSAPTNLSLGNPSSTTVPLSWNTSIDNTGISGYDIYVNGVFHSNVPAHEAAATTIANLTPSTPYSFYITAKDLYGNSSGNSNTVTTTTPAGIGSTSCGSENFENIPILTPLTPQNPVNQYADYNLYTNLTWTGTAASWTATGARPSETISGRAITIKNGALTSSSISGGISSLTITTQQKFSGTPSSITVQINGVNVGTIPYSNVVTTTTINNLNISGDFTIKLIQPTANKVAVDNISWTCSTLSTEEAFTKNEFSVYPNPVTDGVLNIKGKNLKKIERAEVYTLEGHLVQIIEKPFKYSGKIILTQTKPGMYILKAGSFSEKFIVK